MSLGKKIFCFLFLIGLFFNLPSYASDVNKELNEECDEFCDENDLGDDGYYLAPELGAKCKDGYKQSKENQICCCEPKAEE